ncbi:MAG TPA: M24 family metallopeptidase [Acidimicrobiia bacterium]|nr:M24 family metallopeptidase [Acidimicrobiia bacterium]
MTDVRVGAITTEPYPRFSDGELQARRQAMLEVMDGAGVAHLVAYGSERTGSAVQWLSEWPVTREAALVLSPGEPIRLLVQHYNHLPNARRIASDCDVEWGGPSTINRLGELLRARLTDGQRVGVVGPLRFQDHRDLAVSVGDLVSLDRQYQRLRLVKSAEEIERLEVAAHLSDRAVEAIAAEARVGMDEHRLAAIIESAYLAEGGTNHIHYFAATPMADPSICVPSQFHSTRRLQAGDILFCEISAAYWGYAGQVLRSFAIGADPTPLYNDLHRAADGAFDAIAAVTRPGTHVRDLVDASSVIEEMGFTIYDDLVHGYGGGYLPPVLGSRSRPNLPTPDMVLEEGMALVIQPNVITTDERAGVQTGHLVVVTGDGHRPLHDVPRGLRRIG